MAPPAKFTGRCPYCDTPVKEANLPKHLRGVHPSNAGAQRWARELEVRARREAPRRQGPRIGPGFPLGSRGLAVVLALGVAAAAAGAAYYYYAQQPNPDLTRNILDVCYGGEVLSIHRHATLNITLNHKAQPVPAGIGIPEGQGGRDPQNCWRPLHTHTDDATIHIESNVKRDWTLGELFVLWEHDIPILPGDGTFDQHTLLDKTIPGPAGNATMAVEVDGRPNFQYQGLVLAPMAEGTVGGPIHHIWINYTGI